MLSVDVTIRQRLQAARIPAMPQILVRLIAQCQADKAGITELAELVGTDSAIAARVLEAANSSAFHRKSSSPSIGQALMTLGTDAVKMLLINQSVFHLFDRLTREHALDLSRFWRHSLATALTARRIAHRMGYAHVEEAYLAGLLHDIGRLALLAAAPEEYALDFDADDDEVLCAKEQRSLQITHPEAGALLIEQWQLDSFIADSVLYHHDPAARLEDAHPLIRIVFVAHLLADGEPTDKTAEAAQRLCALVESDIAALRADVAEAMKEAAKQFGIDLTAVDTPAKPALSPVPPPGTAGNPAATRDMAQEMGTIMLTSELSRFLGRVDDEADWHAAVVQALHLLFGIDDAVVLLTDDAATMLFGTAAGHRAARISQFSAALSGNGALATAVRSQHVAVLDRQAAGLGLPEEQLLRLMEAECLVCVPLTSAGRCQGLLVGAVPRWRATALQEREGFLEALGRQSGQALTALRTAIAESAQQAEAVASRFRKASRQVAHEINNPLSIIRNYLGVLDHKLTKLEPVHGEISILTEEIDRVGRIVAGLADLQISPFSAVGNASVNEVIDQVASLVRNTAFLPSGVRISLKKSHVPLVVRMNSGALKQVLLNLVKNGVEAVGLDGNIEIGSRGPVNRDGVMVVELWVTDDGPGISADRMPTLFTGAQSTKEGPQRGQGLAIVHQLVKDSGGFITCRSSTAGTTFELLLPAGSDLRDLSTPQL